jgi:hypothetical protein
MSFVKDLFSAKPDKPPEIDDPSIDEARRKRRLAASLSKGRSSTIFAGPGGVDDARLLGRASLTGPAGG